MTSTMSEKSQILPLKPTSSSSWSTILIVRIGGEEFHLNKPIIRGKSDALEAMFASSHFVEGQENRVTLEGTDPNVFKVIFKYLFENKLPDNVMKKGTHLKELLVFADKV